MQGILKLENGINFDFTRSSLSEICLEDYADFFASLQKKMVNLEAGEIANESENRMVGHYWLRDTSLAPNDKIAAEIEGQIEKVKNFYEAKKDEYSGLIWLGIGGSALGPDLLRQVFKDKATLDFRILDNIDPGTFYSLVRELGQELKNYLIVVVSKSGGTRETMNMLEEFSLFYQERGWKLTDNLIAITMEESSLDLRAKKEAWLERFYLWDWVGGRSSISSAAGLLALAFLGGNISNFLAGFRDADILGRQEAQTNPALLLALDLYLAQKEEAKNQLVVLPYKDQLVDFPKYLQQLLMESLGKEGQGISVFGNKGSSDQHSYLQQLFDGPDNFIVHFIEVRKYENFARRLSDGDYSNDYLFAFNLATASALASDGRKSAAISLPQLDEYYLGCLIGLYERLTSFYAFMLGINAYDQPAVERGKAAAKKIIVYKNQLRDIFLENKEKEWTAQELAQLMQEEASKELAPASNPGKPGTPNNPSLALGGPKARPSAQEVFSILEYMVDSGLYPLERVELKISSPLTGAESLVKYRGIS